MIDWPEGELAPAYDPTKLAVGQPVVRYLAGKVAMPLNVTELTDTLVTCGWWEFDRATGMEIDEDLGWGPERSGSFLTTPDPETIPPVTAIVR